MGLFRVVFWCIYIVPLGVYLDLRSKRTEKKKQRNRTVERQGSKEAEKQRSREKKKRRKAKKTEKQ